MITIGAGNLDAARVNVYSDNFRCAELMSCNGEKPLPRPHRENFFLRVFLSPTVFATIRTPFLSVDGRRAALKTLPSLRRNQSFYIIAG
jgi:hypothetical protein